jgi:hypothetical protein
MPIIDEIHSLASSRNTIPEVHHYIEGAANVDEAATNSKKIVYHQINLANPSQMRKMLGIK